jgi:D-arabinose 1-dehydrogenase-like Zn-dependent alcohol dehydrogenase
LLDGEFIESINPGQALRIVAINSGQKNAMMSGMCVYDCWTLQLGKGRVVSGGIHMSDIPSFPYSILWGERTLCSVANLTRIDGEELLALAPKIPIKTTVNLYSLDNANKALEDLRAGLFTGSYAITI